jgi:hypothetical protein
MLFRLLTSILIFASLIKTEASSDLIKETREKISQINISFYENGFPDKSVVSKLDKLFSELKVKNIYTSSNVNEQEYKIKSNRLIKAFQEFENYYQSKPEVDSLKKVFRNINNEFNSLFGNHFLEELKKSSKKKIIVFSTSMSCECTLEMCYKQEAEIQKLLKENPVMFDYAVVDCFTNFDLQSKYDVGFIPVVLVLDKSGKEVKRFVREENLYSEIKKYLTIN